MMSHPCHLCSYIPDPSLPLRTLPKGAMGMIKSPTPGPQCWASRPPSSPVSGVALHKSPISLCFCFFI